MTRLGENGPIVVVGAGPCGALLSIYLAEQGHEVVVVRESARHSSGRHRRGPFDQPGPGHERHRPAGRRGRDRAGRCHHHPHEGPHDPCRRIGRAHPSALRRHAARGHPLDLARRSERDSSRPGRGDGPGPHRVRATVPLRRLHSFDAHPHRSRRSSPRRTLRCALRRRRRRFEHPRVDVGGERGRGRHRLARSRLQGAHPSARRRRRLPARSERAPHLAAGRVHADRAGQSHRRLHRHPVRPERGTRELRGARDT